LYVWLEIFSGQASDRPVIHNDEKNVSRKLDKERVMIADMPGVNQFWLSFREKI